MRGKQNDVLRNQNIYGDQAEMNVRNEICDHQHTRRIEQVKNQKPSL